MTAPAARFLPSGDTGLTISFDGASPAAMNQTARALHARLTEKPLPGVIETVPTFRALLIHYDPLVTSQAALVQTVTPLLTELETGTQAAPRRWTLPVCFEDPYAPALPEVVAATGLNPEGIRNAFTETVQVVQMIGFAPGMPYLGDLPDALALPRRQEPVPAVPEGSVLTATGKTVIYPAANPTGWYAIGRTPVRLFSVEADPPVLLAPGDEVIFTPISAAAFDRLDALPAGPSLTPEPSL